MAEDFCFQTFSLPEEGDDRTTTSAIERWHNSPHDEAKVSEEIVEDSVESLSPAHTCIQLEEKITSTSIDLSVDTDDLGEIEDEENDELLSSVEPTNLFPTSVLDKTSIIAERFASSLSRKTSSAADDVFSINCQLSNTRNSVLNAEPAESKKSQDSSLNLVPEHSITNPRAEGFVPSDQRLQTKDTLSKIDRMLIHKIKQYYEYAEDKDACFSIKRRESLSYIPAGLVQNMRQQLDDHSTEESAAVQRKDSLSTRPTSWAVFDLPGLHKEKSSTPFSDQEIPDTIVGERATYRTEVVDKPLGKDNDFRSSSEMIEVWQDMESSMDHQSASNSKNILNVQSNYVSPSLEQNGQMSSCGDIGEPLLILKEIDHAGQGPLTPSPSTSVQFKKNDLETSTKSDHTCNLRHASLPKIISLRSGSEEDLIHDQDMETMKNKVFHLARQYSQRIKKNRPLVRQRAKETKCHKPLSLVMEDSSPVSEKGKCCFFKALYK